MSKKVLPDLDDGFKPFPVAYHDFYKPSLVETTIYSFEPSLTAQEFAEECDINVLMQRHPDIGTFNRSLREPVYADFTSVPMNLQDAMHQVKEASDAFYQLPANVRREFDNDPVRFADFAVDPANLDTLREWGLAKAAPVEDKPMRVEVINPAPPLAPSGDVPKAD